MTQTIKYRIDIQLPDGTWTPHLYPQVTTLTAAEQQYDHMRNTNLATTLRLVQLIEHVTREGKGRVYD